MATSTTSTEPELISEYWNNRFINELRNNLVFAPWGLKGTHPKGSGTMVHWLSLADLSASSAAGTEGTDPTEHTLSAGDQTATVSQYTDVVKVSDILQETWLPSSMGALMERLARVAAKKIDTVVRDAAFTAGGTVQYAGTAIARNSIATDGSFDMDLAEVREATRTLEGYAAQSFPDGYYRGIVHPDVKNLTSLNLFNSVKLQNGQYRAKPLGEGVTNIREILRRAIKRCSELGRNAERITEMLFRSLSLQPDVA